MNDSLWPTFTLLMRTQPLGLLGWDMGHEEGFRVGTVYLGSFHDCTPLGLLGWDMGHGEG